MNGTRSPAAGAERRSPPWINRDFALLWTSQTFSDIGWYTSVLAFPLLVLSLNGSPVQAGALGTAVAVVRTAAQIPGGALADRWNRRRLMQVSDGARAALFGLLAAAVITHHVSVPMIFAVAAVGAIFDVMFAPAETAALKQLVPEDQLPGAFAKNEARSYAASLAGPPLGGLLFGLGRAVPFLFDAASYLVSLLAVSAIRRPLQSAKPDKAPQTLVTDMREGITHVLGSPFLRALVLIAAPINFAVTGALFSVVVVLQQGGSSSAQVGLAQGTIAVGGLLGAVAASWLQRRLSFHRLLLYTTLALALLLAAATVLTGQPIMVLPLATGLFFAPAVNASLFGRLAATTPDRLQGRVISVVVLSATAVASLAPLATGTIIEHVNGTLAMAICAAAAAGSAATARFSRHIRE